MTSVPSLSYLCAKTIALDPALHKEREALDSYSSHPASKIYRDILVDSIQSYCDKVEYGKKFLQLAEMGIIDLQDLFSLVKEKLESNSAHHVKSFKHASIILSYTILEGCPVTKEARAQRFQALPPNKIAKIQYLIEDVQEGNVNIGNSITDYADKHYKLYSDDPLFTNFQLVIRKVLSFFGW